MWIVELAFNDEPERLAARAAHRQRLSALQSEGVVRMAGPFADDSGAMIVFDVADQPGLEQLMADDPYFTTPGVRVHQVRQWRPFLR
ncbi:YciI family protein [Micromonospora sp. NPDC049891]|uniref:YciI family protein n=1 Tax=Micromonospora sp. NPDC049891 TaxID=3155655 RepID=UPI00340BFFCA